MVCHSLDERFILTAPRNRELSGFTLCHKQSWIACRTRRRSARKRLTKLSIPNEIS